jgi:hypothetical protein
MEAPMSNTIFVSLGRYGRAPRKGEPAWSCISGITSEGARVPTASNHIKYRCEARILHGDSPLEAGRLATERANQAFDHGRRRRRLRRDGIALLAGVVSYPVPRQCVNDDPCDQDVYGWWRAMTVDWLVAQFGDHLHSVVEHTDEEFLHLHFYVVPLLGPNLRLDMREIHPGERMKADAAEAGACKKFQDAAYRSGMSRWQDDYWVEVGKNFGHDRYGPRRQRVNRMQHRMEKRIDAERERRNAALAAERESFEYEMAQRRTDLDRQGGQIAETLRQEYEKPFMKLRAGCIVLKGRVDAERARRKAAEAEIVALRARLVELEPPASLSRVA